MTTDELELTIVAALPGGPRQPVTIRAGRDRTVADLAAALDRAVGTASDTASDTAGAPALHAGQTWLRPELRLIDLGLLDGTLVGVGAPVADLAPPAGGWEVAVVGGLQAGPAVPARPGVPVVIGRGSDADLAILDTEVSRVHATVTLTGDGDGDAVLADLGSRNGTGWQGYRLDGPAPLGENAVAQVGESVVGLRRTPRPDPVLEAGTAPGTVRYNRPPRIEPPATPHELALPDEPEPPRGMRLPLAAVLLPLGLGAALLAFMGPTPYLLFVALSPLMMVVNAVGDRRSGRRAYRRDKAAHDAAAAAFDDDVAELVAAEERAARRDHPDPAALLSIATGPSRRLWERRTGDPDFLQLRIGLTGRPPAVRVRGDRAAPPARLVPVTLDVTAGVVGFAGPRATILSTSRAAMAAAATLHSPRDLRVVVVTDRDGVDDWRWAAWLPHVLTDDEAVGPVPPRVIVAGSHEADGRLGALARLVARRTAARSGPSADRDRPEPGPHILVVLDGARRLRPLAGVTELLHDGRAAGVHVVCLDDDETSLPAECRATVVVGAAPTRAVIHRPGTAPLDGVLLDGLPEELADRLARALAPVRELGGTRAGPAALQPAARLVDLVSPRGRGGLDGAAVRRLWRSRPGGRSTEVLLGVSGEGPFAVDLAVDGPHALVAGTTGSGKSELLQTLVASLALGNRPDRLHVVLVDYKGGAAFSACADLPHCVGLVTDLDGHRSERALASLSAELRRRERLLADAGAKDIEGYWAGSGPEPLARLVIVVDEFATLVDEVPDFVDGVVGIGMRGRSLGIHVVLATQRPAGVVRGDLRANVNLRICLRVTEESESHDVVDAPDAAWVPANRPGRAYARTGHETLTCFQAARVGGPRPSALRRHGAGAGAGLTVTPLDLTATGEPTLPPTHQPTPDMADPAATDQPTLPPTHQPTPDEADPTSTDLAELVSAARAAADAEGIPRQTGPWLPPLPDGVTTADLAGPDDNGDARADLAGPDDSSAARQAPLVVTLGLADLPDRQAQEPFVVDLERTGPVLVCGSSRSGRSTVLRTLATGLADRASPADVHVYVVDAGNRALAPLGDLPHCGAWIDADDTDRVERLVAWLGAEATRRQRHLSTAGIGSLAEQRAAALAGTAPQPGSQIAPQAATEQRAATRAGTTPQSAAPAGSQAAPQAASQGAGDGAGDPLPYLVVLVDKLEAFAATYADRDGGAVTEALDRLLREGPAVGIVPVLAADRTGVTSRLLSSVQHRLVLRQAERDDYLWFDVPVRSVPAALPPGRGFWTDPLVELQVALLDPDPTGTAQAAAVAAQAVELHRRWSTLPVTQLAHRIDPMPRAVRLAEAEALRRGPPPSADTVATLAVAGDELRPVDVDLDTSPPTFLIAGPPRSGRSTALATLAATLRRPLVAIAPRPSPLRDLTPAPLAVHTTADQAAAKLGPLLDEVGGPVAVLVDDAELLTDGPLAELLRLIVREGRDHNIVLVAATTTDDMMLLRHRGWLADARRSRCGLLLCPGSSLDGDVFDVKLPRSVAGGWPPGRGVLVARGRTTTVQVAQLW